MASNAAGSERLLPRRLFSGNRSGRGVQQFGKNLEMVENKFTMSVIVNSNAIISYYKKFLLDSYLKNDPRDGSENLLPRARGKVG
jgi:hypothetical protein